MESSDGRRKVVKAHRNRVDKYKSLRKNKKKKESSMEGEMRVMGVENCKPLQMQLGKS